MEFGKNKPFCKYDLEWLPTVKPREVSVSNTEGLGEVELIIVII